MELRCFCNLGVCGVTGQLCKSRVGCFRELEGLGVGCLELRPQAHCAPLVPARLARDTRPYLHCCRTHLCNYLRTQPVHSLTTPPQDTGWTRDWDDWVVVVVPVLGILFLALLVFLALSILAPSRPSPKSLRLPLLPPS